jgi:hemolysin activation/secretion protein
MIDKSIKKATSRCTKTVWALHVVAAVGGTFAMGGTAWSQSVTPGDLQRDIQPAAPSTLPSLEAMPPRLSEPSKAQDQEAVMRVLAWRLVGNTALTTDALLRALKPFTNVDLSVRQMREAAAVLQQVYQDAGFLVRVLVPSQDITSGTVELRIVESRLGRVTVEPSDSARVDLDKVRAMVQSSQASGELLRTDRIGRGVLLADDLAGVTVASSFQPGAQEGTTDVVLLTSPDPLASLNLTVDNGNSRSVGSDRVVANLSLASPFGYGETLSVQMLHSLGSDYARLGASLPAGLSGLKVSPYASSMDYKVVVPDANGLAQDISGDVRVVGLDVSYPLIRQPRSNLYLESGWNKTYYNSQTSGQFTRYSIRSSQVGLQGNAVDAWGGGGATAYGITYQEGTKSSDPFNQADPATLGDYHLISWSLSRQQALKDGLTLYAALRGQDAGNQPLDGAQSMSLGGPAGVRAFPSGEASGPQARMANLELRWRVHPDWLITPFYDWGRVYKRASAPQAYSLKGAGLSVAWTSVSGWTAQATYAHRTGNNPNADTTTGNDSDGSLERDRWWLSLSRTF